MLQHVYGQMSMNDTLRWQLNATLSSRLNSGNVSRFIITPEVNVTHISRTKNFGFSARERYTYGTFGDFTTERDLLSRNFFYLFPERKIYPYLMLWFQTHERQRLEFRYQVGPGITFSILKNRSNILKLSFTGSYERNWYKIPDLTLIDINAKSYETVSVTTRLYGSHQVIEKVLDVYFEGLFQQSLQVANNWRIFAEGGVNANIVKGFSLRSYVTFEYQRVHVTAEKPNDLVFNTGLNYTIKSRQ